MTDLPNVGLYRSDSHEYWFDGQGPLPGVTSAIAMVDKSGPLVGWAKRITAEFAVHNLGWVVTNVMLNGVEETIRTIKSKAKEEQDAGMKLGSRIHILIEDVGRGKDPSLTREEKPYVEAYRRFLVEYQPQLLSLEKAVISFTHGYGGTFDIIADIGGERWLIDAKTNKPGGDNHGVYPETALQLAAYANADFIGLPGDPKRYPMPKFDRFGVLHLRPDGYESGYRFVEYHVGPLAFSLFLSALDLLKDWRRNWEEHAIGDTVPLPVKALEGVA